MKLIIILSIYINIILCKKKKKSKYKNNNIPLSESIRPSDVSRELFCDVCQAMFLEAFKNLRNLNSETDVIYYLNSGICAQKNFNDYHFSKPEMEIGCEIFLGAYSDIFEQYLLNRDPKNSEEIMHKFCNDKIQACTGVDLTNIKPIESEIVNGELYDIEHVQKTYKITPELKYSNYDLGEEENPTPSGENEIL